MLINRNNYEEFLLMYVDNELPAADRICVELFIEQNSDLKEELILLQQAVLLPDDGVTFYDKQQLLLPTALQSSMLLLLDGELPNKEATIIKNTIKADTDLQQQYNVLQQTKLVADTNIVFTQKAILYKKENNKVLPIAWWRLAAAAIFIGSSLWLGIKYYTAKSIVIETSSNHRINNNTTTNSIKINTDTPNNNASTQAVNTTKNSSSKINNNKFTNNDAINTTTNTTQKNYKQLPINDVPNNIENNDVKSNIIDVATVPIKTTLQNNSTSQVEANTVNNSDNNFTITPANFTENNNTQIAFEEDANDNTNKKSKLNSFLKKAKRLIERKTKIGNGTNEVKVANLSFAIQ
jgi:hypothetical protein